MCGPSPATAARRSAPAMVGNSLRSDIWPALAAGALVVHIPHEFEWARERAETPEAQPRFRRLASLAELPAWLDEVNAAG